MNIKRFSIGTPVMAALLLTACWEGGEIDMNADGGGDLDGDTDTDTDTDGDMDADADLDVDADTDTDSDTGDGQEGISFVVINRTGETRYLKWIEAGWTFLHCSRRVDGQWHTCFFELPICEADCTDMTEGGDCCITCNPTPSMRAIAPGEGIPIEWDTYLFTRDDSYCGKCFCYNRGDPAAGHFEVSVSTWPEIQCFGEDCEPDELGVYTGSIPVGEETRHPAEFDYDFQSTTVYVDIL